MNILYLTLDSLGGFGGIAQYCSDVIRALSEFSEPGKTTVFALTARQQIKQLPPKTNFFCTLGSKSLYVLRLLRFLKRRPNIDLVMCGHINLLPLGILAKRFLNKPLLLFIYGIDAWHPLKTWHRWMIRHVSSVISISQVTLDRFLLWAELGNSSTFILPNAIDLSKFTPGPKDKELLDRFDLHDRIVLLTFGRLVSKERYKGFDEVLQILPELKKTIPNLCYVIAGDGDDKGRLQMKARCHHVEEFVRFTGYIDEEQKIALYRSADVYAMPSRGEGFGFVLLEAAACGVPVIGSTTDGTREALRNGRIGRLVNPDSPDELLQAINDAIESKSSVPRAELEYFGFDRFSNRLYSILTSFS